MTVVRGLYERFRQLVHDAAKFGVVGAIAFLTATVGTNLLHFRAGLGPLTSNVIATIAGICVAFFGNRYWTYRYRAGSHLAREYAVFFVLNGIALGIQLVCIGFTYYLLNMHGKLAYNVALIFGIGLGTIFRFWSYRHWVWPAPPVAEADAMAGGGQPSSAGSSVVARSANWPGVRRRRERVPAGQAPRERERARQGDSPGESGNSVCLPAGGAGEGRRDRSGR